jgi:hypothetical protein
MDKCVQAPCCCYFFEFTAAWPDGVWNETVRRQWRRLTGTVLSREPCVMTHRSGACPTRATRCFDASCFHRQQVGVGNYPPLVVSSAYDFNFARQVGLSG